ncbi:MAG: DUF1844 domain-containing protein [Planctomycetia bacterium]
MAQPAAPGGPAGGALPPPFELLLGGLAAQAQVGLGLREDPLSKRTGTDLAMARQAIDMLGALEERTRGNLSAPEARLLGALLADLRLAYARVAGPAPR